MRYRVGCWLVMMVLQACAGGGMPKPADGSGMGVSSVESTQAVQSSQTLAPESTGPVPSGYELGVPDPLGPTYVSRYQSGY